MCTARAKLQDQRAATVGASSESRCHQRISAGKRNRGREAVARGGGARTTLSFYGSGSVGCRLLPGRRFLCGPPGRLRSRMRFVVLRGDSDGGDILRRCLALGHSHEEFLRVEGRQGASGFDVAYAMIGSAAVEQARLNRVGKVCGENLVADAGADLGVADGEDDFAALEEVAGHPVSAAEIGRASCRERV